MVLLWLLITRIVLRLSGNPSILRGEDGGSLHAYRCAGCGKILALWPTAHDWREPNPCHAGVAVQHIWVTAFYCGTCDLLVCYDEGEDVQETRHMGYLQHHPDRAFFWAAR